MPKPPRPYHTLPPDEASSIEVSVPNRVAAQLWSVAEEYRSVVNNKDEIICDVLEGWLSEYVRVILKPRLREREQSLRPAARSRRK